MRNLMLFSLFGIFALASNGAAISYCNGPCKTLNDCDGQLICIGGKCNDDPDVGTHICGGSSPSCPEHGTPSCQGGKPHNTYDCSPPVTASTPAKLTLNDFSEGGDGGYASECDEKFHSNSEKIVALSTGWFARKSRCGNMIRITAGNGRYTTAKVVDECDSRNGCDDEHAGQRPCEYNVVDGSAAIWNALGLNKDLGEVAVTWSLA